MLFNSLEFVFLFLPTTLLAFHAVRMFSPGSSQLLTAVLLFFSLFFYGYWNPDYLLLLIGSILFNFMAGRLIRQSRSKLVLALGVTGNLFCLGYFKYAGFITAEISAAFGTGWSAPVILLPLAISFFTFQQVAYLVDCYRGTAEQDGGILQFGLFVSFFPQLIAGPIVRHADVAAQFRNALPRPPRFSQLGFGVSLFIFGLFKKVAIADSIAPIADASFAIAESGGVPSLLDAWAGLLAFTLQIYFDFSGYTDMALGLAAMFGITLPMNFASPYKATSIIDFWRRWHMTLSAFLRDYIYIPLGGGRSGSVRRYINLLFVMLAGGLWHGAGWNFVLWGGCHGLMLCVNHGWKRMTGGRTPAGRAGSLLFWAITFLGVSLAWVLFRADNLDTAIAMYRGLAGLGGIELPAGLHDRLTATGLLGSDTIIRAVQWTGERSFQSTDLLLLAFGLFCCLILPRADQLRDRLIELSEKPVILKLGASTLSGMACGTVLGALFWATVFLTNRERAFLYFQF